MFALARLLFGVIASTLASVAVVIALVSGVTGLVPLLACAVAGGLVALPISYLLAKRMTG